MSDQFTIETLEYTAEVQVTDSGVQVVQVLAPGPPGPPGDPGPPGPGVTAYEHVQSTSSQTWTISHNLGYKPVAQVFDTGSQLIEAEVSHLSTNTLVILLTTPTAGFARLI
jgi:hypothetical protein